MLPLTSTATAMAGRVDDRCERISDGASNIHSATPKAVHRKTKNRATFLVPVMPRSRRNDQTNMPQSARPNATITATCSGPSKAMRSTSVVEVGDIGDDNGVVA